MRKLLLTAIAAGVACVVHAGDPREVTLTVTTGTNATAVVTESITNKGWIETIDLEVIPAGSTATHPVVANTTPSTLANVTLATKTDCAADLAFRPRFDGTDTAGSALTSDPPTRYMQSGLVVLSVTNASATNLSFKAVVKYETQ